MWGFITGLFDSLAGAVVGTLAGVLFAALRPFALSYHYAKVKHDEDGHSWPTAILLTFTLGLIVNAIYTAFWAVIAPISGFFIGLATGISGLSVQRFELNLQQVLRSFQTQANPRFTEINESLVTTLEALDNTPIKKLTETEIAQFQQAVQDMPPSDQKSALAKLKKYQDYQKEFEGVSFTDTIADITNPITAQGVLKTKVVKDAKGRPMVNAETGNYVREALNSPRLFCKTYEEKDLITYIRKCTDDKDVENQVWRIADDPSDRTPLVDPDISFKKGFTSEIDAIIQYICAVIERWGLSKDKELEATPATYPQPPHSPKVQDEKPFDFPSYTDEKELKSNSNPPSPRGSFSSTQVSRTSISYSSSQGGVLRDSKEEDDQSELGARPTSSTTLSNSAGISVLVRRNSQSDQPGVSVVPPGGVPIVEPDSPRF